MSSAWTAISSHNQYSAVQHATPGYPHGPNSLFPRSRFISGDDGPPQNGRLGVNRIVPVDRSPPNNERLISRSTDSRHDASDQPVLLHRTAPLPFMRGFCSAADDIALLLLFLASSSFSSWFMMIS